MKIKRRSPDPFFYQGGETGILLIHGFTGTPSELRPMGQYLKERGYTVHAPLLAGHGTSPEEMECTAWTDWWQSVLDAYDHLCEKGGVRRIVAAGLSMGGALALNLARTRPLAGVVSLCAPIYLRDKRHHLVDAVRWVMPYLKRGGEKPGHIEEHLVPYDRTPLKCISSLNRLIRHVRRHLPEVEVPALVVQAKKDETVIPRSALYIYHHISSEDKRLIWYEKSSHIITLDKEREQLFADVDAFARRLAGEGVRRDPPEGKGDLIGGKTKDIGVHEKKSIQTPDC
ncbi:carboxylesterase [Melghirimyces profundicolus]|uniref:Carboxylesterase n=1 Tax=Melghirimyces profundicolus TaxID=1242148 RepID=A0A2T6BU42_9BACL|nr:alpha/beta fold hydrolase [Melghirimyces profundicolus]PTX59601.1 carboxylesterase [Melghirimyces profundicolus]